ncbi:glutamate--tRNA ligase, partial [Candidatus Woesearchaeota archaeon]|nr:glutamate--tRNA ligase [Candidatus Woesearchaeota archaeon]
MEDTIRRLALANAIKFKGKADPKAVIGGLVKEHPETKKDMAAAKKLIEQIVDEINHSSLEQQHKALLELNPSYDKQQQALKKERKEKAQELPTLEDAEQGRVVTRMPPEPSKHAHLGHAISFLINYLYAKMYQGKVVLRLDDTNPETARQEYVDAMQEDVIDYLGAQPDETVAASDHMNRYYAYAEQLIAKGRAYVCNCPQDAIKQQRRDRKDCPHRNQSLAQNKSLWKRMKNGESEEGE